MANYRFDLGEWLPRLPLDIHMGKLNVYGEQLPFSGEIVTGPCDLCRNEHLRRELSQQIDWGPGVSMDVFVMANGEPSDRHVTKVGGLPYLPTGNAWPSTRDGTPMTFLGQFCFADSRDLVGELPGDVLLIFCGSQEDPVQSLVCEWQPLGLTDLIAPDDIPKQPWQLSPCYGHVCRVTSFPEADRKPEFASAKYLTYQGIEVTSEFHLYEYQATQIGTAPFYIQGDPELPGNPLCTLSSVQPDLHSPYPWVNRADPLCAEGKWVWNDSYLMFGDAGCLYISIDGDGVLHFAEDCY